MGDKTGIEWSDATWNPTTGCDKVSPGCDNCYALTMAARLKAIGQERYQTDGDPRTSGPGFGLATHEGALDQPLRWRKPRLIFVNSMSDLFHPKVPDEFIARVFAVMTLADRHVFQILTKRPKRMRALLNDPTFATKVAEAIVGLNDLPGPVRLPADELEMARVAADSDAQAGRPLTPRPNVWLGTSVEDQRRADERIPELVATPAAVRFLSMEPLLGPVDLAPWIRDCIDDDEAAFAGGCPVCEDALGWVIVGGESGPDARPMHPDWVRSLRDQCVAAGVAFMVKQWGEWAPSDQCGVRNEQLSAGRFRYDSDRFSPDGTRYNPGPSGPSHPTEPGGYAAPGMESLLRVGKKKSGRTLDGQVWDQMPANHVTGADVPA